MCARRVAHFSPRRGRLASSSTGCNRTAATNCKLSAGRPGETSPIRHHFHHLHHRPPSIILRVICSALLRESKKTCPRPPCHQHFYSRLTSDRILFEYVIYFRMSISKQNVENHSVSTRLTFVPVNWYIYFSRKNVFFFLNRPT